MPAAAHGQQWHGGYATLPSLAATAGMEAVLSLQEEDLLREGKQVLVAYNMKPKAGYNYLATAAHFPAESSTGTNVNVCTTDDFTKTVDAPAYYIDPEEEEMRIACSVMLFDGNFTDGRAMMCSSLTLNIGNNQGMGDVEYGKIYDIYFPPSYLRLFDDPSCSIIEWRTFGRGLGCRHHHQAEYRLVAQDLRRGLLRLLAGRRFHQERRAPGKPGLLPDE